MIERRRADLLASSSLQDGPPPILLLAKSLESPKAAREFAREFIAYHVPGASEDYVDSVVLVVCELVTNSVRYGTEPGDSLRVTLNVDDTRTRVEVRDPVRRRPRPRPVSVQRDRGRGLIILDALCPGSWGVDDAPFGKTVWAEVKGS
jgi:two-component sensor histidine kinase